jgi:hypothetical protein
MKLTFRVSYTTPAAQEITEDVTTTLATVVAWERRNKDKFVNLQKGFGMDDMLFMAWHCLNVEKREPRSYDEWLPSVTNLEVVEASPANPTQAAATDGS